MEKFQCIHIHSTILFGKPARLVWEERETPQADKLLEQQRLTESREKDAARTTSKTTTDWDARFKEAGNTVTRQARVQMERFEKSLRESVSTNIGTQEYLASIGKHLIKNTVEDDKTAVGDAILPIIARAEAELVPLSGTSRITTSAERITLIIKTLRSLENSPALQNKQYQDASGNKYKITDLLNLKKQTWLKLQLEDTASNARAQRAMEGLATTERTRLLGTLSSNAGLTGYINDLIKDDTGKFGKDNSNGWVNSYRNPKKLEIIQQITQAKQWAEGLILNIIPPENSDATHKNQRRDIAIKFLQWVFNAFQDNPSAQRQIAIEVGMWEKVDTSPQAASAAVAAAAAPPAGPAPAAATYNDANFEGRLNNQHDQAKELTDKFLSTLSDRGADFKNKLVANFGLGERDKDAAEPLRKAIRKLQETAINKAITSKVKIDNQEYSTQTKTDIPPAYRDGIMGPKTVALLRALGAWPNITQLTTASPALPVAAPAAPPPPPAGPARGAPPGLTRDVQARDQGPPDNNQQYLFIERIDSSRFQLQRWQARDAADTLYEVYATSGSSGGQEAVFYKKPGPRETALYSGDGQQIGEITTNGDIASFSFFKKPRQTSDVSGPIRNQHEGTSDIPRFSTYVSPIA